MVRIVTDSAADFEPEEYRRMGVTCIPITVSFGMAEYRENVNLTKKLFYHLMQSEKEFPRTSQPSPYAVQHILEEAMEQGEETVVVTLSSALSGTFLGVSLVKKQLGYENCYIVDSLNATGGQRILVEQAVRLRDMGKSAREITRELEELRGRIRLYACINTLEYLYKGGRISRSLYTVGSAAQIKPIIRVSPEGKVEIPQKTLGMKRGIQYLLKKVEEQPADPDFPFYVMYTADYRNALELIEHLQARHIPVSEKNLMEVGAAIGSHVGPDGCGFVYVRAENHL